MDTQQPSTRAWPDPVNVVIFGAAGAFFVLPLIWLLGLSPGESRLSLPIMLVGLAVALSFACSKLWVSSILFWQ